MISLCLFAFAVSSVASPSPVLTFTRCAPESETRLRETLGRLPPALFTLRAIELRCVETPRPYGAEIQLDGERARILLAPLEAISERRARYRLRWSPPAP